MTEPIAIGALVFACTFGGALLGIALRRVLPSDHLSNESKDTVMVAIGLIATMTALVLGLITAGAKSAFDSLDGEVKHTAAELVTLDRTLARYGPETYEIRQILLHTVQQRMALIWPQALAKAGRPDAGDVSSTEMLAVRIGALTPQNEEQRRLQARAIDQCESLLEARWLVFASIGPSVPVPFLAVLIFWLTLTFTSFGLFAPWNATVLVALLACTLSVACAIFLVLEMDGPFQGLIRISPDPVNYALEHMAQ